MTARCPCHGVPYPWCTEYRSRPDWDVLVMEHPAQGHLPPVGPDNIPHRGAATRGGSYECDADCPGWHQGVVTHAPDFGDCAICGDPYQAGELVAKMPLPTFGQDYGHANGVC